MEAGMPQPGPEHEVLAKFVGEWAGPETTYASAWCPDEKRTTGHSSSRSLEGFFVVSDYEQRSGDEVTFRGHGIYSFDPEESCYVMYWFDSMGGAGGVAKGQLEGDKLTFLNATPMGHFRYRYTFSDEEMVFEMATSPDGSEWNEMMIAHYRPA